VLPTSRGFAALAIACLATGLAWEYTFAATPKVLTVVQNADATTLEPWNSGTNVALGLDRAFYEKLFGFDSTMMVRPVLAKSGSVSLERREPECRHRGPRGCHP